MIRPLEGIPVGFRFRKSIKILPGVRLNLEQVGHQHLDRCARRHRQRRPAAALRPRWASPARGLSYSEKLSEPGAGPASQLGQQQARGRAWIVFAGMVLVAGLAISH